MTDKSHILILVVAGSGHQYNHFLSSTGLPKPLTKYIPDEGDLHGVRGTRRGEVLPIFCGSYYERKDYYALRSYFDQHGIYYIIDSEVMP